MKKKIVLTILLTILLTACTKDSKVTESSNNDTLQYADSLTIQAKENPNAFSVEKISEEAGIGKTIFRQDGKTIIIFDTQGNTRKININGAELELNQLTFSENNYEILGSGIRISAENGNFQETTGDCNNGSFSSITIQYNNNTVVLPNVKVQDCPSY